MNVKVQTIRTQIVLDISWLVDIICASIVNSSGFTEMQEVQVKKFKSTTSLINRKWLWICGSPMQIITQIPRVTSSFHYYEWTWIWAGNTNKIISKYPIWNRDNIPICNYWNLESDKNWDLPTNASHGDIHRIRSWYNQTDPWLLNNASICRLGS